MKRIRVLKANTQVEPAYMGLRDLAAWSGIGLTRLRGAVKSGDLPSFKYGGTFLVSLEEFSEWMEQHRYQSDLDSLVDQVLENFR